KRQSSSSRESSRAGGVLNASSEKGRSGLPFRAVPLLWIVGLSMAGCADLTDDTLQRDVVQLRRDVNTLMIASNRARSGDTQSLSQIESRSREQASESARQTAALSTRLDALSAELTRLSTRIDELSQRVESARQNQRSAVPARPVTPPPVVSTPPPL